MPPNFREHLESSPSLEEMAKRSLNREQTKSFADLLIQTLQAADAQFSPAEFLELPKPVQVALRSHSDPRVDFDTPRAPKSKSGPSTAMHVFEKLQSRLHKASSNPDERDRQVPRRRLSSRARPDPGQRRPQGLKVNTLGSHDDPPVRNPSIQASPRTIMFRSGDLYFTATEVVSPEPATGEGTGASYKIRAYTKPPKVTDEPVPTLLADFKGDDDVCVWPVTRISSSDLEDSEPKLAAVEADDSQFLTPVDQLTAFLQKANESKGDRVDVEALDALRDTYKKRCGGDDPDCPHVRGGMHPTVHKLLCGPKRPAPSAVRPKERDDAAPEKAPSLPVPESHSKMHRQDTLDEMFRSLQVSGQDSFKERIANKDVPEPETPRGRGRRRRRKHSIEERERPTIPVRGSSRTRTGVSDPENGPRFGKGSRPPLSRSAWAHDNSRRI